MSTPDLRFFETRPVATLGELAGLTGAELSSTDAASLKVASVAILGRSGAGTITFLTDKRYLPELEAARPTACFISPVLAESVPSGCVALVTRHPQAAYALAAQRLHHTRIHAGDQNIAPEARIEDGAILAPGVVVGQGAQIGRGTQIGANTVVGPGVTIGRDCVIGSNVSIGFALIGDRVHIHSNAVIGAPGFGAAAGPTGIIDIPQLGRVILQDGVTIGANSTVDRGAFDDTVIGENTKLDNLVHIAHNVRIGRNCVMAAYTGISGSVTIGDGCRFGGRAGVADHLTVGDGAQVGAGAAVLQSVPPGAIWSGMPARPVRQWLRETAWVSKSAAKHRTGATHD